MSTNNVLATISTAIHAVTLNLNAIAPVANTTTPNGKKRKRTEQLPGESIAQCWERNRVRRMANTARMKARRDGIEAQVFDQACSLVLEHRIDSEQAVRAAMPKRFEGKLVGEKVAQDIIAGLTTRFSRGVSPAHNKIRRPKWEVSTTADRAKMDAEYRVYVDPKFAANSRTVPARTEEYEYSVGRTKYKALRYFPAYGGGPANPFKNIGTHTGATMGYTPVLQGNRDVAGTLGEALASGGQRSDSMGKTRGMSEGSARLSNLWHKVEGSDPKLLVNEVTGSVILDTSNVPVTLYTGSTDAADTKDIPYLPNLQHEKTWTMLLARVRIGPEPLPNIRAEQTDHVVPCEIALRSQYGAVVEVEHGGFKYDVVEYPALTTAKPSMRLESLTQKSTGNVSKTGKLSFEAFIEWMRSEAGLPTGNAMSASAV